MQETYRMWVRERREKNLIGLREGFLEEYSNHIAQLRLGYNLLEKSSLRYKLITRELELLKYMLQDMIAIRQKKVLSMGSNQRAQDLLQLTDDWNLLRKFLEAIEVQEEISEQIIHGRLRVKWEISDRPATAIVRISKEIPAFADVDGEERGPYRVEDVVSMPAPNALMLVRQHYAKAVSIPRRRGTVSTSLRRPKPQQDFSQP